MPIEKVTEQDGQSANIIDENIEQMKALFPDAFTEGADGEQKVDFAVLRQLLGDAAVLEEGEEKYGLNWHGKKQARQIALTPSTGTLLPCPEESVDWDTTQNLFIEGDNLEVLKLLQKSYAGKVKMIYIDPPYNTGKEFIYPDNFQDNLDTYLKYTGQKGEEGLKLTSNTESGGRKHTNWLSMMLPRLRVSKSLLKAGGLVFISIDDAEFPNLRFLCDEVFGAENFAGSIVWKKKTNGNNVGNIPPVHDYIVAYGKSITDDSVLGFPISDEFLEKTYKNPDHDPRGAWTTSDLSANHEGPHFPITNPNSGQVFNPPKGRYWVFNEKEVLKRIDDGRIIFGKSGNAAPVQKKYLSERASTRFKAESWWDSHGMNSDGTAEMGGMFEPKVFDHPKPTRLLQNIVEISTEKDDVILDFFAGSGSMGHAVFSQNAKDGAERRFILTQLPEEFSEGSIASKLGYSNISELAMERLRRAADAEKKRDSDVSSDLGFRVFKLASSNINAWNPDRTDLEETLISHKEHLVEGRSDQDVLYELLLKRGIELTVPIEEKEAAGKTIYSIGYGVLFACLDTSIAKDDVDAVASAISQWHKELEPETDSHVFFRDSAFADDCAKSNMVAILEQNGIAHVRSL